MFKFLSKRCTYHNLRRHISALYVTGDKAMENCVVINPYLDIDHRLKNFEELKENIKYRQLEFDLDLFMEEYNLYKAIDKRKKEIEDKRAEIGRMMKQNPEEALALKGRNYRDELKKLKENSYHLEDQVIHKFLSLPNYLHEETPKSGEPQEIFSFLKPTLLSPSVRVNNDSQYFIDEAAEFDLFFPMNISNFYSDKGFIKFSNPDFARSVINEALGADEKVIFKINEDDIDNKLNLLHLCGGGSLQSFLPYITKLSTFPSHFPLKLISNGKSYEHADGDFVQSTCTQIFIATNNSSSFKEVIKEELENVKKILNPLNQHYRIVVHPAINLTFTESYKIGIEMFARQQQKYIEIGNLNYYHDMISKRLLFNIKNEKNINFPFIYGGTLVNNTKLLKVLLENDSNIKLIVESLKY